jgi:hypothetical protein
MRIASAGGAELAPACAALSRSGLLDTVVRQGWREHPVNLSSQPVSAENVVDCSRTGLGFDCIACLYYSVCNFDPLLVDFYLEQPDVKARHTHQCQPLVPP